MTATTTIDPVIEARTDPMPPVFYGQRVRISVEFRDADGDLFDPSIVRLSLITPSQAEVTVQEPSDLIQAPSTGVYYREVVLSEVGEWRWRWESLADGEEAAAEGRVTVPRRLA